MKVKLNEVVIDEDIYPRLVERGGKFIPHISQRTVEGYVEALKGGATFPPIVVQKVKEEKEGGAQEKLVCLDGWHRILAYQEFNRWMREEGAEETREGEELKPITEVEAVFWRDEVLDKKEWLEELRIESARRNLIHGDRLTANDIKLQAIRIVRERPLEKLNGVVAELAKKFQRSTSYISKLIGDELRKRRMSRDAQIYRLHLLGWTQQEISSLFGLTQGAASQIIKKFTSEVSNIQKQFLERQKTVEEIAKFYNLDDITAWAVILQGREDLERFELFGRPEYQDDAPRIYNVWNFNQCDPRLGVEHPGRIPGQIVMNLLYYYTEQGDLVVDPMAGGGSTIDACLIMGRKCRAYDINPVRRDIIKHDLRNGFPEKVKGCDFIFLDPPYWNLQKGLYTEDSISEVGLIEWLRFMKNVIKESYNVLREGGKVALIVEAIVDERESKEFYDLPYECMKFFEEVGFKEIHRISVPVTTQVKTHHDVEFAKRKRILLDVNRDLIIYRK